MTKMLDKAIEAVRALPHETQDEFAHFLLELANQPPTPLSPEEAAAIAEAEIAMGVRVPAETMQAFWRSHGV